MGAVAKGLAGVVVDQTAISNVCAEGILTYRGLPIDELVEWPLHRVASWVVVGEALDSWADLLCELGSLSADETALILALPATMHPMRVIQGVIPLLDASHAELGLGEADSGLVVAAQLPAVVATHLRRQPLPVSREPDYARRVLHWLGHDNPSERHVRAFNTAQILQLEHSFNAGTFAARVVASTLADVAASMSAGIGALSGPLHGGADQAVMDIADRLDSVADAEVFVNKLLKNGDKLPGMGHREYRVRDPRAVILQHDAQILCQGTELETKYEILCAMEAVFCDHMASRGKPLHANVEFYKGLVYRAVGLPNHFFTAGFAMARVFGYLAHFIESRADNRIFRPAAEYVGN
jgi:citrate synthase